MNTITYEISDKLYINLTNRCTNNCTFCVRNYSDKYSGYHLRLTAEPKVDYVIQQLNAIDLSKYSEIVFCGYGEPMMRAYDVLQIATYLKTKNVSVRINTNGQYFYFASKILAKTPFSADSEGLLRQLSNVVDTISISLNEVTTEGYQQLCRPNNEKAFENLLEFTRFCTSIFKEVVLSIVDIVGEQKLIDAKRIADNVGATLRVREFISDEG